jgi:cell division protein FtsI/penicillin-binding protein 2
MAQAGTLSHQQETIRRRLPFVIGGLIVVSLILLGRLASIQFQIGLTPEVVSYLETLRDGGYTQTLRQAAARGQIFDRNGESMAVNTLEYQVGISPQLLDNPRDAATQLSSVLGMPELDVFEKLEEDAPWVLLAPRVSAEVGRRIAALDLGSGVQLQPLPRRSYPQGPLAAHILGFVSGDLNGFYGVEGYYQDQLTGVVRTRQISNIPFDQAEQVAWEEEKGRDLVLTIDRDVQFLAETELTRAISDTGAEAGTIIVMNPRTGDILALANYPSYDPNAYFNVEDAGVFNNLAISGNYEPGSVMKLVTIAGALDRGVITPDFTYIDNGSLDVGGVTVYNWDREAYGASDVTSVLVNSLNVGAATVATMEGPQTFYEELEQFGFGQRTGIDLQGEEAGILFAPGDPDWSEGNLATNAFGQGISVTPIQMLCAVNAIANGGLMMQPRVVRQIVDGDQVYNSQPTVLGRPISSEAAAQVTNMMVQVVANGLDNAATLPGYTIAGKTGTAEIATPFGYESNSSIVTFVGFLPADDPQISVLVRLDRPRDYWASLVAAPVFQRLAERLVVALSIPPDDARRALAAEGGSISNIQR